MIPAESHDLPTHVVDLAHGWNIWKLAALRSAGLSFDVLEPFATPDEMAMAAGDSRDHAVRAASRRAMRDTLLDRTLRSALTWQNPQMIENWVGDYATRLVEGRQTPDLDRMDRREAVVAHYAQRYAAKNDTIGFFGPLAWARWGAGPTGTSGSGGIRRRAVRYEVWALESIARAWNDSAVLRDHLPVRLDPALSARDGMVRRPLRAPVMLDSPSRELIRALPGIDRVSGLVARFGPQVRELVDRLRGQGILQVGFRVPLDDRAERHLRGQVEQIADVDVRTGLLATLDDLEEARAATERVADEPAALRAALAEVDCRLTAAAGASVQRSPRLAAGGRTPVFLDCRRDIDMTVGDDLLALLATPLGIVLDSARWLAGQVGTVVGEELDRRYAHLSNSLDEVTLADLQLASADILAQGDHLAAVQADFQLRWAEVLPVGGQVSAAQASRLAAILFPQDGRLWTAARSHSPDLMLRDLGHGRASWVLGELHVALNTMESRVFRVQADRPEELVDAVAADVGEGRVVPVYPNSSPTISSRTYPPLALDPPGRYRYWSYGTDDGHPSGAPSTPAADLVVTSRNGDLVARSMDHGWEAPVLECFGEFLTALVVTMFRVRAPRPHTPRGGIGDLVVCRETWRLATEEFGTVVSRSVDPAHDRLRDLARNLGMPRHVFVRTPAEAKPFYVDFLAPALVDNLARAIRRAARLAPEMSYVEIVEMLPTPDELWLTDPEGRRYTSELRVVAVDSRQGRPASSPIPGVV